MNEPAIPEPTPDPITNPYWESIRAHRLRLQRCRSCGKFVHYPRPTCPGCQSDDLEWVAVTGRGKLFAFTIPHRHANPAFRQRVPYIVALVELEEGPRVLGNLRNVAPVPENVHVGMAVKVAYEDLSSGFTLVSFHPR